ncbi:plasma membrane zinc ion transporter [Diplodia corticola]|uniref:Plasma membrane zinc ion transporter n=1 Tax=Diplodia corticola TaxID=236234 RepID=A0A1J9RKK2_9PEZI|nr:plasma membrane zinc ion transporter [Diplodia corticola]OJD40498.1 plasma membrane zinc ion transporter [Diplodia corticola]
MSTSDPDPTSATPSPSPSPSYNTPLHIAALFIILVVSTLSCSTPLLTTLLSSHRHRHQSPHSHSHPHHHHPLTPPSSSSSSQSSSSYTSFLFAARHFGTGVLLATAFVHLLPTAFTALGDPRLPPFWTETYTAMPGAIVLAAVLGIAGVEMALAKPRPAGGGSDSGGRAGDRGSSDSGGGVDRGEEAGVGAGGEDSSDLRRLDVDVQGGGMRCEQQGGGAAEMLTRKERATGEERESREGGAVEMGDVAPLTPEQERKKELLQCMLLEMGILFHSVFIGMALSVSVGKEFVILLIAIAFHQTFEGLALGSRIAALRWERKAVQPWMMSLAYGCTTPLGQAIGLGVHTLYSPDSEVGLLVVGIMNAISAGLLVYASLVELLAEDFLSDESWRVLRGKRRAYACLLVVLGAIGMSLVGAWA